MSYSFEDKLAAVQHELAVRQWWQKASADEKAFKPEAAFRHIEVLEEIATDYRRAIDRRSNVSHLRVVRPSSDAG